MTGHGEHWERIHGSRAPTDVSWYARHLSDSLRLIAEVTTPDARVIDVGAGASTLVDDLLDAGYGHLTVLDIAPAALELSKARLGERAEQVRWIVADVTELELRAAAYDLWHDRAVFHFLIEPADRRAYVESLSRALCPGGHLVIGTFALDGPTRCSGLPVQRHDAASLSAELGPRFRLEVSEAPVHVTPAGVEQAFCLCRFKMEP